MLRILCDFCGQIFQNSLKGRKVLTPNNWNAKFVVIIVTNVSHSVPNILFKHEHSAINKESYWQEQVTFSPPYNVKTTQVRQTLQKTFCHLRMFRSIRQYLVFTFVVSFLFCFFFNFSVFFCISKQYLGFSQLTKATKEV